MSDPSMSTRNLIRKMNVVTICTTDDPVDSLVHHQKIKDDNFEIKVLPAFRPDKAMDVKSAHQFNSYIKQLEAATNLSVSSFDD
ncbi:glucuronate isomerase, partial [Shewanella indica]|uniref:glucuronate isomerase n=1 Tax=Shewanella indica TaxID=768528 RepID=UPI00313C3C43